MPCTSWYIVVTPAAIVAAVGAVGVVYLVPSMVLGLTLIGLAWNLKRRADRKAALRVYLFSLAYLAALFAAMVADLQL